MYRYYSVLNWRKIGQKTRPTLNSKMKNWLKYDFYFILDFESTCDNKSKLVNQEIIEFPCLWADNNFNVISNFHRYVKPTHNPILTPFCTQLTGIMQSMVEKEETFDKVFTDFNTWLKDTEQAIGPNKRTTFVTCGDWDLKTMLPNQCQLSQLQVPNSMTQWLNLKKITDELSSHVVVRPSGTMTSSAHISDLLLPPNSYNTLLGCVFMDETTYYPKSLRDMSRYLGLTLMGREHSGIDDCWNILRIMKELKQRQLMLNQLRSS